MYVRLVWGKLRLGTWTEYERHFNDRVATHNNIQGLRERQLLRSRVSVSASGIPWKI